MKTHFKNKRANRGYTLIEALMASAILMIGVGAAASMSLTMVTQEEIIERTVRAMNHLENAGGLYRMGIPVDEIEALLPADPVIQSLTFTAGTRNAGSLNTGIGALPTVLIELTFVPSGSGRVWAADKWTGGENSVTRSHTIEIFRGSSFVTP